MKKCGFANSSFNTSDKNEMTQFFKGIFVYFYFLELPEVGNSSQVLSSLFLNTLMGLQHMESKAWAFLFYEI